MGRLGGPKALGIVLQEKIVCQEVVNGEVGCLILTLRSKAKLGSPSPKAQMGCLSRGPKETQTHAVAFRD